MHDGPSGGIAYCNFLFFPPPYPVPIRPNKSFIVTIFMFPGVFFQSRGILL